MSVSEKYGLAPALIKVMTDPSAAIADLHAEAVKLQKEVAAIDAATSSDATPAANPLEVKYGKDEAGKSAAEDFLRTDGGVFDSIVDFIDEDPGRTFHVLNAVQDLLVKYLRNEADFHKSGLAPKSAKISRKGEFKSDFNEIRELIRNVAGMAASTGWNPATCDLLTEGTDGKYKSILPGFRGTKSTEDGAVTGRYAKVYGLDWTIDGEAVEDGWTIPSLVRMLWSGSDRIGKRANNLTDILDNETDWTKPDFKGATFIVNDHEVSISRTESD